MPILSRRAFTAAAASSLAAGFSSRYRISTRPIGPPAGELAVLHDDEGGLEASICPSQGGELCSLRMRHKGQWHELLYRAADYSPADGWRGKAPLLWPTTGRSFSPRGAGYVFKDRFYPMADHGFVREMPWELVGRGSDESAAFVSLRVGDTAATRRQYPFGFGLTVDYRVSQGVLHIAYKVTAAHDNSDAMFFPSGITLLFGRRFWRARSPRLCGCLRRRRWNW